MPALDSTWRKSSRSNINGSCVEARQVGRTAQVRDSKDRSGPTLSFTADTWTTFIISIRDNFA